MLEETGVSRNTKPASHWENAGCEDGGKTRNRTGDTLIFSQLLYQLSYLAPTVRGESKGPAGDASTGFFRPYRRPSGSGVGGQPDEETIVVNQVPSCRTARPDEHALSSWRGRRNDASSPPLLATALLVLFSTPTGTLAVASVFGPVRIGGAGADQGHRLPGC
jgi:hypothetical protein